MSLFDWLKERIGIRSPSRDFISSAETAKGVDDARAEALYRLYALAARLRKHEVEFVGVHPDVRDARWAGREMRRLLDAITTPAERVAVEGVALRRGLDNLQAALAPQPEAKR